MSPFEAGDAVLWIDEPHPWWKRTVKRHGICARCMQHFDNEGTSIGRARIAAGELDPNNLCYHMLKEPF